jgi:heme oxygenase
MSQTNISAPLLPQASNSNATGSAGDREFARTEVQKARASLDAAEARLDAYCNVNSPDLTSENYLALVREVDRRSAVLTEANKTYRDALNGGIGRRLSNDRCSPFTRDSSQVGEKTY